MPATFTEKQKKAFSIYQKKGKSVSRAMREAGYSEASARVPQRLTKSDSWLAMMGKQLSDEYLFRRHKFLIARSDGASIARGLDMAYKLKKYYADDNANNGNINVQIVNYANRLIADNEIIENVVVDANDTPADSSQNNIS